MHVESYDGRAPTRWLASGVSIMLRLRIRSARPSFGMYRQTNNVSVVWGRLRFTTEAQNASVSRVTAVAMFSLGYRMISLSVFRVAAGVSEWVASSPTSN